MKEVIAKFTSTPIGSTFFHGSKPIDGVWATSDITVCNAAIMSAGYGIGDHRLFVINFSMMDIIGKSPPRIVRLTSRCLNTKIPRVEAEYMRILEGKIPKHRLIERTGAAHTSSRSRRKVARQLNQLDDKFGQYMHHAEKKCWKIKSGRIHSCQRPPCGYAGLRYTGRSLSITPVGFAIKGISSGRRKGAIFLTG